jgi:hypothetical protein
MRRPRAIIYALSLALLFQHDPLLANGRFPRAQRIRENNGNPERLALAATYGLLVTNDRGGEWRHICELAFSPAIDVFDPLLELAPDGSLLVTSARALGRALDPFCVFDTVLGGSGSATVADYALDPSDRTRVLAVMMRSTDDGIANELFESRDAGRTFEPFGAALPSEVAFTLTLDIAPSDAERIYVSALGRDGAPLLVRTTDGGATFTAHSLPLGPEEHPYLAAVHPRDADIVYLRTDYFAPDAAGVSEANDALYRSEDGGESFREVARARGKLLGFALSPDSGVVLVGYGDPVDVRSGVEPSELGIYRASTADHAFAKIIDGSVTCLEWTATGLYVCTTQRDRGFELGFAPDASFSRDDANPLVPLLDLSRIAGPLECPPETKAAACESRWPRDCGAFGACQGTAGSGASGAAGAGASGTNDAPSRASDASGCGCRTAAGDRPLGASSATLLAAGAFIRRRREATRRRSRAAPTRAAST